LFYVSVIVSYDNYLACENEPEMRRLCRMLWEREVKSPLSKTVLVVFVRHAEVPGNPSGRSALEVCFTTMRYMNRRFIYLLTYPGNFLLPDEYTGYRIFNLI